MLGGGVMVDDGAVMTVAEKLWTGYEDLGRCRKLKGLPATDIASVLQATTAQPPPGSPPPRSQDDGDISNEMDHADMPRGDGGDDGDADLDDGAKPQLGQLEQL